MPHSVRCPRGGCGEMAEATTNGAGRLVFVCRPCERNRLGICRDCPNPIRGRRSFRCASCRLTRRRLVDRRKKRQARRDPEENARICAKQRRYRAQPHVRAAVRLTCKRSAAKHPRIRDGFDRIYQREWFRQRMSDPTYRARRNAQLRARRKKNVGVFTNSN